MLVEAWKESHNSSYHGAFLEINDPIARIEALISHVDDLTKDVPYFVFRAKIDEPKGKGIQRIEAGSESPFNIFPLNLQQR